MVKGCILLVEDNPDDQKLTVRALKKNNITNEIVIANDGQQALDFCFRTGEYAGRDSTDRPSLILLDLKLPKIDGLEVLKRLRADERTMTIPIVILTSSREEQDLITGYQRGANSYVQKPVDFLDFVSAAGKLGVYWLMLNEPPPVVRP